MDVRRQYSLPNCTLILEGSSDNSTTIEPVDGRPVLSSLTNATCYFAGVETKLQGGRTFLENLVKAVSAYAQECLSGVHHPSHLSPEGDKIYLEKIDNSLHRLLWQPPADVDQESLELQLTSIQLFDLVEAVDQFFADSYTLPDLSLKLQPLSRRYRQPDEPFIQRLVPLSLGIISLAIVAFISYLLPIPEVKKPEVMPVGTPTQTESEGEESSPLGTEIPLDSE